MDSNLEALENLRDNLREHGLTLEDVPHIIQHNKRDLPDILPIKELDDLLNEYKVPSFGTAATRGDGVYEALDGITRLVISAFESSIPPGERQLTAELEAIEGGLGEALRNADASDPFQAVPAVIASLTEPTASADGIHSPGEYDRGAEAPGEVAARAALKSDRSSGAQVTLCELWPEAERAAVREVEAAIAGRRYARAIELCDALVTRVLASAAGIFGSAEAPRDAATVPLLLGLDGRMYLAFRALVREARSGGTLDARAALEALVFAAQARILRSALRSPAVW
jgi:hypothetical protein